MARYGLENLNTIQEALSVGLTKSQMLRANMIAPEAIAV